MKVYVIFLENQCRIIFFIDARQWRKTTSQQIYLETAQKDPKDNLGY